MKISKFWLVISVVTVAVTGGIGAVATAGGGGDPTEGSSPVLSNVELLGVEPIDAESLDHDGWDATLAMIRERAVKWYVDQRVADWSDQDLEAALAALWDGIANPSVDTEPEQLMLVQELIFRHEAVCRSLSPSNPVRTSRDHCSDTSAPSLDGEIPWATE